MPEIFENSVYIKEAEGTIDSLIEKIKKDENLKDHYGFELEQLLNDYYNQIKTLFVKHREVQQALKSVSRKRI